MMILIDMVNGPAGQPLSIARRLADIFERYESQHPVHRAVTRSRSYLEESSRRAAARVGYPI
jgi:hypothetical protein